MGLRQVLPLQTNNTSIKRERLLRFGKLSGEPPNGYTDCSHNKTIEAKGISLAPQSLRLIAFALRFDYPKRRSATHAVHDCQPDALRIDGFAQDGIHAFVIHTPQG